MDDALLTAFAREANAVSVAPQHVTAIAGAIGQINRRVAEAALARLDVTQSAESFESFRASYAPAGTALPE